MTIDLGHYRKGDVVFGAPISMSLIGTASQKE